MKSPSSLSSAARITVAALLVAAFGFMLQIVSGVEVPAIPPGLVILLVAAGMVAFTSWRWIPAVGALVGLFLLVGFFASGSVGNLLDAARIGVFVGSWVQFIAVIVALVAGSGATVRNYAGRT